MIGVTLIATRFGWFVLVIYKLANFFATLEQQFWYYQWIISSGAMVIVNLAIMNFFADRYFKYRKLYNESLSKVK
jgi:hypothetical protein